MKKVSLITLAIVACYISPRWVDAAEVDVRLENAPTEGTLVFQVYDEPDAFSDLRDPAQEFTMPAAGDGEYRLDDVVDGRIALLVYYDENDNGRIDKSFIGIPREMLAISNGYKPKGPPRFAPASFDAPIGSTLAVGMEMYRVLGERGRWGLGASIIGRSSPYVSSSQTVTRLLPAVTYVGERLQWFGPRLRYGIAGSGRLRVAVAAEYRIGAYEETDSDVVTGLGDRDDTLLAGLGLEYEIADGLELELLYQHDVLDRIGGGMANVRLSRGFTWGAAIIEPQVAYNWLGPDMSNHDFGVPVRAATVDRPAYSLGSTNSVEFGVGVFVELSEDWRMILNIAGERLDDNVAASPIVDDDFVVKGLAVISYVF